MPRRRGNLIKRMLWFWKEAGQVSKLEEKNWIRTLYNRLKRVLLMVVSVVNPDW